jgi:hypothetical protein
VGQANAAGDDDIERQMTTTARGASSDSASRANWVIVVAVVTLTAILLLQKTKQALLPAYQTKVLWYAELATIAAAVVLRSGWGRDNRWAQEQARLGTLANNFYEPRRGYLTSGFAVGVGVFLCLWWAIATWSALLGGVQRGSVGRGMFDFVTAAVAGAITGGMVGAAIGLAIGHIWETRHRRRRRARETSHA